MTFNQLYLTLRKEYSLELSDISDLFEHFFHKGLGNIYSVEEVGENGNKIIDIVKSGYPICYLTHKIKFCQFDLFVDERVLIPRPETEELMYLILENERKYQSKDKVIYDVCTGSGAIAIALTNLLNTNKVIASDISKEALEVAKRNNDINGLNITFIESDYFKEFEKNNLEKADILVSNPPYIPSKTKLDDSLSFEPQQALFGGEDGLDFFKAFKAENALNLLKKDARIYIEVCPEIINEAISILEEEIPNYQFKKVKDMSNKERFIFGSINNK